METINRTPKWHDGYGFRLSIGWVLSLTIVLTAFEWKSYGEQPIPALSDNRIVGEEMLDMMQAHRELPPPPPKAIVQPEIVPVDDDQISETLTDIDIVFDALPETKTTVVAPVVVHVPEPEIIESEVFDIVEEQAFPEGGWDKFYRYVGNNLKYPAEARRSNVQGKVFVQFVIEKDGSITQVETIKGIGSGCDEEAIRIIANSPRWKPAKQRGRPVRQRMVLPFVFQIQ